MVVPTFAGIWLSISDASKESAGKIYRVARVDAFIEFLVAQREAVLSSRGTHEQWRCNASNDGE
jgi:hypothetical protein